MLKTPSKKEAKSYLQDAARLNPGVWIEHSLLAAQLAEAIAELHPELEPEPAYACGCLHDIGRRFGVTQMRHTIDGYNFMTAEGYDDVARICLTHSFPTRDLNSVMGERDWTDREESFVSDFIFGVQFDTYDRLLQLCDAVSLPPGGSLIEKRIVDAALRYGINEKMVAATLERWRAYLRLEVDFSAAIGQSIYRLLPDIVESTFGFDQAE